MKPARIGERLVRLGAISRTELKRAIAHQESTGQPLGAVCEELLGVDPRVVEQAWSEQYAELVADLEPRLRSFDPECIALVSRRQAWQFAVLPLRMEGGALVVATLASRLAQARRFLSTIVPGAVILLVTDAASLARALEKHHPLPGMNADMLLRRQAV